MVQFGKWFQMQIRAITLLIFMVLFSCEKHEYDFALVQIDAKGKLESVIIKADIDGYIVEKLISLPYIDWMEFQNHIYVQWESCLVYGQIVYRGHVTQAQWNRDSTYKAIWLNK